MSGPVSFLVFLLIAALLGCVALIIYSLTRPGAPRGKPPAYPLGVILSEDEAALYDDLRTVCANLELRLFSKVSLGAVLDLGKKKSDSWAPVLRGETVDFVITSGTAPELVLFMEQKSALLGHERSDATLALEAAGIPHIVVRNYNLPGLEKAIREKMAAAGRRMPPRRAKYDEATAPAGDPAAQPAAE